MKKIIVREFSTETPSLHQHPVLHRIYAARGIKSPDELEHDLRHLLPFATLKDIDKATALLTTALREKWYIIIVGDFDVDGATSTALTVEALKLFGFDNVSYIIPNRFTSGYGLTKEIVESIVAEQCPQLIITVDNGISSIEAVEVANTFGIKVLITDHHLPGIMLPNAAAIINPNQAGDNFASKALAGVGVVFYLMLALRAHLRDIGWFSSTAIVEPSMAQFLDLVALGTIADAVILDRNNRILVANGIKRINMDRCRPGILAIFNSAKRYHSQITTYDLGFVIAPRLNAAGRLDNMSLGVEALLAQDKTTAENIARQLEILNNERRVIESDMQVQALRILDNLNLDQNLPAGISVFEDSWHQGILGILASRLKDKFNRPVIVFTAINENEIKGSARSINELHILDIISGIARDNPGLIARFGGHAMAAGLNLQRENFETFAILFAQRVEDVMVSTRLESIIHSDGELDPEYLDLITAELIRFAGPWGAGFVEPIFHGDFQVTKYTMLAEKHLKLTLHHLNSKQRLDAIYFNADIPWQEKSKPSQIKIIYRPSVNEYNGKKTLQLIISEILGYE
jgi:single-stranded-DNA-specific exonuclease